MPLNSYLLIFLFPALWVAIKLESTPLSEIPLITLPDTGPWYPIISFPIFTYPVCALPTAAPSKVPKFWFDSTLILVESNKISSDISVDLLSPSKSSIWTLLFDPCIPWFRWSNSIVNPSLIGSDTTDSTLFAGIIVLVPSVATCVTLELETKFLSTWSTTK